MLLLVVSVRAPAFAVSKLSVRLVNSSLLYSVLAPSSLSPRSVLKLVTWNVGVADDGVVPSCDVVAVTSAIVTVRASAFAESKLSVRLVNSSLLYSVLAPSSLSPRSVLKLVTWNVGVADDAVVPSYDLVSVTAAIVTVAALIVPEAVLALVTV